ncbi:MAG: WD40 repeat domain-containing protein [Acidimicrobiia bacterium]
MTDDRLTGAAADLRAELARVPIPDPPTSRRTRLRWILVPAVVAVALVVVLVLPGGVADPETVGTSLPTGETSLPPPTVTTTPPTTSSTTMPRPTTTSSLAVKLPAAGPIFGETTGVVLLLDDGLEGLTAIDPDRRLAHHSSVEGQRRGDEPYSMILVGDRLVVGWGEPHAVDIDTREAISLGMATIFVPAAEANRVWLIDYPGGRIGSGTPLAWQVDVTSGEALQDPVPLPLAGYPGIGIEGGFALQTDTGLNLWNVGTGEITALESDGTGFPHDVFGEELIWCSGDCSRLAVTNTVTMATSNFDPLAPFDTFQVSSRMSPDGRYLAALVGVSGTYGGHAIWILDRETGEATDIFDPESRVDFLAWSPDGEQLFATSYSYGATRTTVWRYDVADGTLTTVVLPFGEAISLVVIDASMADAYFADEVPDF